MPLSFEDLKGRPFEEVELLVLRAMTPQKKLDTMFGLSAMTRSLLRQGLRLRFPDAGEKELHRIYLERMEQCYNRNY